MKPLIFCHFLVLFLMNSFSGVNAQGNLLNDESMAEKARKRMYPGGADEEDLKVRDALPYPIRKVDPRAIQKQVFKNLGKAKAENEEGADQQGQ